MILFDINHMSTPWCWESAKFYLNIRRLFWISSHIHHGLTIFGVIFLCSY